MKDIKWGFIGCGNVVENKEFNADSIEEKKFVSEALQ
jgi:hypothetical protein